MLIAAGRSQVDPMELRLTEPDEGVVSVTINSHALGMHLTRLSGLLTPLVNMPVLKHEARLPLRELKHPI